MQRLQRGGRGFLHRIGDGHHASDSPVQDHEHHGFALVAALIRPRHQIGRVQAHIRDQSEVAKSHRAAINSAANTLAGDRLEIGGGGKFNALVLRAAHDGFGKGMFRPALQRGGKAQHFGPIMARFGKHRDQAGFAFGQGAGFVYDQRVDLFEPLQRLGVFDENACLRAPARGSHDRHRSCQPQGAGAGDDQHCDGGDKAVGQGGVRPPDCPADKRQHSNRDHRGHEEA
jgi:hypothetical protein